MSDINSLLRDIKAKKFAPVYILMGEEEYFIDALVSALEENVVSEEDAEFDRSILYGADTNGPMVMEAASQFPMFSDKRLVILKEGQAMARAKTELDKIASYMVSPNPQTVLAISYKGDKLNATSALLKSAKKNKDIVIFESPKIRENKVGEYIRSYCASKKVSIEEGALELLVANVGNSLKSIFSEIDKIRVSLKEDSAHITKDMVADQIGISKEYNNFELCNAIVRRDYYQSLKIIKYFEENPKTNPTVVLTGILFNTFQRLLLAAFSSDKSERGLMETLQLKSPYALRDIRTGLSFYNASQLVQAIHAIREFDTKSKGIGSMQKEFPLLRELVCRLITL